MTEFAMGDVVKVFYPYDAKWYNVKAIVCDISNEFVRVYRPGVNADLSIPREGAENILQKTTDTTVKVTFNEASELIARMFNELEWNKRTDWTGEEVFNASPTGELFHVFEYYQVAKDYFDLDEDERKKLKGIHITNGGKFEFTVPKTWRSYKMNEEQMKAIIELADAYRNHPDADQLKHHIPIGEEVQVHTTAELVALADYLKGEMPDEEKAPAPTESKRNYQEVEECPNPYVGLEWTEQYSYYGKVVGKVKRSLSFEWQKEHQEWKEALAADYFIVEDTVEKTPYILTTKQFKEKFSYNSIPGCWVRFKFNPEES